MANIPPPGLGGTFGQEPKVEAEPKDKGQKEFKLEGEKEKKEEKKEVKEPVGAVKEGKADPTLIASGQSGMTEGAPPVQRTENTAQIEAINKIIMKVVESLQAGEKGASVTLKEDVDVPKVLQGARMDIEITRDRGLHVHFELAEGMSEVDAYNLISQNKQQLQQLALNLQAKRMHIERIEMGTLSIPVAQVLGKEEVIRLSPTPLQPEAHRRRGEDRERGGGDQGPRERE